MLDIFAKNVSAHKVNSYYHTRHFQQHISCRKRTSLGAELQHVSIHDQEAVAYTISIARLSAM